jgi:hypothetical protein
LDHLFKGMIMSFARNATLVIVASLAAVAVDLCSTDKSSQCADDAANSTIDENLKTDLTLIPDGSRYRSVSATFGAGFKQVVVSISPSGEVHVQSNITPTPGPQVFSIGDGADIYSADVDTGANRKVPDFKIFNRRDDRPIVLSAKNAAIDTASRTAEDYESCMREPQYKSTWRAFRGLFFAKAGG